MRTCLALILLFVALAGPLARTLTELSPTVEEIVAVAGPLAGLMFAWLKTLTTAGNKLARSLTALADSVDQINAGLREQVGLDRPARKGKAPVIEHQPTATTGKPTPAA
jgi:hypothetical protein